MDLTSNKRATRAESFGTTENKIAECSFIGDYIFANAQKSPATTDNNGALTVFKFDAGSQKYNAYFNYTTNFTATLPSVPSSNGKWWCSKVDVAIFILFQLDANNQMKNVSFINADSFGVPRLFKVLADDSVVIGMNDFLLTYTYNGTGWDLRRTDFESAITYGFPVSLPHLTDTHLLFWNATGAFFIYRRNGLQWDFVDSHQVNESYNVLAGFGIGSLLVDEKTVVFFSANSNDPRLGSLDVGNGYILFISKINGVWKYQVILGDDLGVGNSNPPNLGYTSYIVNSDTVLVGAPGQLNRAYKRGVQADTGSFGKAYMLQRNADGVWSAKIRFEISNTTNAYFGNGFGLNNNGDALIVSCEMDESISGFYHCLPYYFPRCIVDPINATCKDLTLNDCNSVDINKLVLYTQNDADCGAVEAQYQNVTFKDNKYQATVVLSRPYAAKDVTCSATVTCPAATPSKKTSSAIHVTAASVMPFILGAVLFMF